MQTKTTQAERDTILQDANDNVFAHGVSIPVFQDAAEHGQWLRCAAMALKKHAFDSGLPGSLWDEIEESLEWLEANTGGSDDTEDLCEELRNGIESEEWDYVCAASIALARLTGQL